MRRFTILLLLCLLTLVIFPAVALADNDTPETAMPLTVERASATNRLVGSTGGAVQFYRIEYAGNGQPVPIQLTASPPRGVTGAGFGFKVYGPNGLLGEAVVAQGGDTWTQYALTLASATAGTYLVQVYNYTNNIAVDYTLQASGLAAATTAGGGSPQPVTNTSPEAAVPLASGTAVTGGALVGRSEGTSEFFTVAYPGAGVEMTVEMDYRPPAPFNNNAVGFYLWSPSDTDNKPSARGIQAYRDANGVSLKATYSADAGQILTVQVFNYQPGLTVSYTLLVTGGAGFVTAATDNTTPERAVVLTAGSAAARGTVPASSEPTFHYFLLNYPGGSKDVRITVTAEENGAFADRLVGFNVYDGANLKATVYSHRDSTGKLRLASYTLNQSEAKTFGIQVFNWSRGAPVNYTIFVSGLD